jgi:hypothetical protein
VIEYFGVTVVRALVPNHVGLEMARVLLVMILNGHLYNRVVQCEASRISRLPSEKEILCVGCPPSGTWSGGALPLAMRRFVKTLPADQG